MWRSFRSSDCQIYSPQFSSRLKDIMADATLAEAAALAGIDLTTDCLARYLHAIGLRSHATIAAYVHEDAVVNDLLTKLKAGVTVGTNEFKLPDNAEENALKAQWLVLSRHARHKYQASFQGTTTPDSAPSQPATSTQPDKDTIPKALPSGVYSKLVEDYNSITLDGVRRAFPEKLLLGAEKVLARMYHEHHTSKLYTATPLGEIMAQRVWTSFNTINSNRKKDPSEKKLILDDKNQISEKTQEEWDVKGQWMLIDATQAIRWAWILLKYDSETAINKYVDWFHGLIRKNAQRIPNVKLLWEDFAWDIAMRMRSAETFTAITEDLMVDIAKVNEILQQPMTKKTRYTKGSDSTYNNKGKGYQKWSPPGKGRRYRTSSPSATSTTWTQWPPASTAWQPQPSTWTWPPTPPAWTAPHQTTQPSPTPIPTIPFNPAPMAQPRPTWSPKGNEKGGKKGKFGKGGKK